MKRYKLGLIFILIFGFLIAIYLYLSRNTQLPVQPFEFPEPLSLSHRLSKEEIEADRKQLIEFVEEVHPVFIETAPELYETAKNNFAAQTRQAMTVGDFQWLISEFLSSLKDKHTSLIMKDYQYLDVDFQYQDGQIIHDKKVVTGIDQVKTEDLLVYLDQILPAENVIMQQFNYENYSRNIAILGSVGVDIDKEAWKLIYDDGSELWVKGKEEFLFAIEEENRSFIQDDVFIIDLNICEMDETASEIESDLKAAIQAGMNKVIIDVRDNPGGDSESLINLLSVLEITPPSYHSLTRYSLPAQLQRGYPQKTGSQKIEGKTDSQENPNIDLVVLSNHGTFSSATMLLVWVRDGDLGTIIGEPSMNKPNNYGDVLYFALDYSRLSGMVSHKYWQRPSMGMDEDVLIPDIEVDSDDALETAIEYLKSSSR